MFAICATYNVTLLVKYVLYLYVVVVVVIIFVVVVGGGGSDSAAAVATATAAAAAAENSKMSIKFLQNFDVMKHEGKRCFGG